MPKRSFPWDAEFPSASSCRLRLLSQKTYRTGVLWGQNTCEMSPDECPSHCLPFLVFLSSLFPCCFCWCGDSQYCLGEMNISPAPPQVSKHLPSCKHKGRARVSARQKGTCPGRDVLFAQTKAPPAHLGARKPDHPNVCAKGIKGAGTWSDGIASQL